MDSFELILLLRHKKTMIQSLYHSSLLKKGESKKRRSIKKPKKSKKVVRKAKKQSKKTKKARK